MDSQAVFFAVTLVVQNGESDGAQASRGTGFRARLIPAFRETLPFLGVTVGYLLLRSSVA